MRQKGAFPTRDAVDRLWADVVWGYDHRDVQYADYPNQNARMWWTFATLYPDQVEEFLDRFGWL